MPTEIDGKLFSVPSHVPAANVVDFDMFKAPPEGSSIHDHWISTLRASGQNMVWTPHNGGHWVATHGPLVNDVYTDYKRFSSSQVVPVEGGHHDMLPTHLDPPEHRVYRVTLNSSLAPVKVKGLEDRIRHLAASLIEDLLSRGECCFTTDFAEKFPLKVFLDMIDLPESDLDFLKESTAMLFRPQKPDDFAEAYRRLWAYIEPVVEERKGTDRQDIASTIMNGRVDGRQLTDREAVELVTQVLAAGLDTVVNFLSFMVLYLAEHPARRQELVDNPELIPVAVEEFLRRFPLVNLCRVTTHDMEFGGVFLKQGDKVLAPTMMHGLDERENDDPKDVNFHRTSSMHTTFGSGAHKCPGQHLARTEIRITLEEWLKRMPSFEVVGDVAYSSGIVGTIRDLNLKWDVATTHSVPVD